MKNFKWSLGNTMKVLTVAGLAISFVSSIVSDKIQKQEIATAVHNEIAKLGNGE